MKRVFIGDIQGCAPQLDDLLRRLRLRSDDRLYCVGDLVNRGPDSLGVLRRLRELGARVVLGNHDLHLLRLAAGVALRSPTDHLDAVLNAPDRDVLVQWLAAQPVLRVEDDVVIVHAGLHPLWTDLPAVADALNSAIAAHVRTNTDARIQFVTEVRYCDAQGRRPARDDPPPEPPFVPWDQHYHGTRTVVFGHWARRGLVVRPRVRGLDTGCVYGGPLTAWIAEAEQLDQVPGWRAR